MNSESNNMPHAPQLSRTAKEGFAFEALSWLSGTEKDLETVRNHMRAERDRISHLEIQVIMLKDFIQDLEDEVRVMGEQDG